MYRNSKIDKIVGSLNSTEKDWSKMDLIVTLDMNKEMYLNNRQRQASALLFLVCEQTRNLVDEWYNLGCDYHNIDDSPSNLKNSPSFKEHRHDQSIFSLLTKKKDLFSKYLLVDAINISRNKSGLSFIKNN